MRYMTVHDHRASLRSMRRSDASMNGLGRKQTHQGEHVASRGRQTMGPTTSPHWQSARQRPRRCHQQIWSHTPDVGELQPRCWYDMQRRRHAERLMHVCDAQQDMKYPGRRVAPRATTREAARGIRAALRRSASTSCSPCSNVPIGPWTRRAAAMRSRAADEDAHGSHLARPWDHLGGTSLGSASGTMGGS